ncbi:MAG: hypothetical protein CFE25_13605 [Chitinophagaceae bacterium BSSC1]|nr:MAG: hypothetical protein CFE25_13605 [Chitinophagaceae bacterium BSSC1]
MKKTILTALVLLPLCLLAQNKSNPEPASQIKQFWFVLLKKGPVRNQDSLTATKIQAGHMANITRLYEAGTLKVAGPFAEETLAQGLFIFDCPTKNELETLLQTDPAIKAGRLVAEIHPWYTAPIGSFAPGKPKKL